MSIKKHNIKRRMVMVLALAMTVAVVSSGTAHAQSQALPLPPKPTSLTMTASSPEVVVGEPVTFHITVGNEGPDPISEAQVLSTVPEGVEFESASPSQGECTLNPTSTGENPLLICDLGTLPPGGTAQIDEVLVPEEVGSIENSAGTGMNGPFDTETVEVNAA